MKLRSLFLFGLSLAATLNFGGPRTAHAADVALVDDELGQAVLFSNRGLCYVVLPNHVSAGKDRIALAVAEPAETGTAEIFWRDAQADLALAFVEGSLRQRCQFDLNTLSADLSNTLQRVETGMIKSVHFGGAFFDRLGASLVDVDENFVTVRINEAGVDAEVMQGLSGALLSVAGRPAGIAIDAGSASEARFLRMDRIAALVGANLSTDDPATRAMPKAEAGMGFRVTDFAPGDGGGVVSLEPGDLAEPWVAKWTGKPLGFEITLSNEALVQINKITMGSSVTDETTAPRQINIQIDRGLPGSAYWTSMAAPDMAPNGVFEMTTGGTVGRRVRITFQDVWNIGKPVRLDRLIIE